MEKFLTGPNLMFLGLLIWSGMMLRNAAARSRRSRNRDVAKELQTELRSKQKSAESQIRGLEVRLLDFDRDISARVDTTMTLLDQLIAEADREIVRLETLLAACETANPSPLSAEDRRMLVHLAGAGYSDDEIARFIDRPVEDVRSALDEALLNRRAAS